ncbi:MAG: hypothetical protein JKX84_00655 [Flavobacteriales bacterium]|nr:hypothetical protein [Flavobacteriales bacterium]
MEIFKDPAWKTRDQGTLIATAWEYDLKDQKALDSKWNYIVDYRNPTGGMNEETGEFTTNGFETTHTPAFVHVYHHFGDTEWYIWNWIIKRFNQ